MSLLFVEQKKGDPDVPDGRLTVYAKVDTEPGDMALAKHPVAAMITNGFLVAQGNFRDQNSLRDFLKSEMGLSLEEGLEQLVDRLDGLESALDPEKLKEKIEHMGEMEDFIPTPAKIVPFRSEEEILSQEGDIFYTGIFRNIGNAMFSVNGFPMLYQARYREQLLENVRSEIDNLIALIENNDPPDDRFSTQGVDVEQKIMKEFIPNMLYSRKDRKVFETAAGQFRTFMTGYQFHEDVNAIIGTIREPVELSSRHYKLLEMYARKIAEIQRENFTEVERLRQVIDDLEKDSLKL